MGPQTAEISAFKFLRPVWTVRPGTHLNVIVSSISLSKVLKCALECRGLTEFSTVFLLWTLIVQNDILTLETPQFMWQIWCGKAVTFLSFVLRPLRGTGASFKRNHQHHWQLGGLCCGSHGKRSVRQRKWKLNHSTPDAFLLVWITSTL